jgi:hypothetical protein
MGMSMGFSLSLSLLPVILATGLLAFTLVGLPLSFHRTRQPSLDARPRAHFPQCVRSSGRHLSLVSFVIPNTSPDVK